MHKEDISVTESCAGLQSAGLQSAGLKRDHCTWLCLVEFSALVPVIVRRIPSPPTLGAAPAARVYRVLVPVMSSLGERTQ